MSQTITPLTVGSGMLAVNCYLITTERGFVLVDTWPISGCRPVDDLSECLTCNGRCKAGIRGAARSWLGGN